MTSKSNPFLTIGQIARRLDEPLHRVEYAIKSRAITPNGIAGIVRLFREDDIDRIADALREIDARREGGVR